MSKPFKTTAQVLMASRCVERIWRVGYVQPDNELTPKKPLYFLKEHMISRQVSKNEVIRLV